MAGGKNKGGRPKATPMERKAPVEFTPERKAIYLQHMRQTGLRYLSAERAGISTSTIEKHKKLDPVFADACEAAKESHTDELIEEAMRRAKDGVSVPIIGGKFKDEVITYVQEYSDRLMEVMLKSRREEFRGRDKVDGVQTGGVLIIPAAQTTMDDWEAAYGEAAKGKTGAPEAEA